MCARRWTRAATSREWSRGEREARCSVCVVANCLVEWLRVLETSVVPAWLVDGMTFGETMSKGFVDMVLAMVGVGERGDGRCPRRNGTSSIT